MSGIGKKAMYDFELEISKNSVKITNNQGRIELWKGAALKAAIAIIKDAATNGWMGGKDVEDIEQVLNDL